MDISYAPRVVSNAPKVVSYAPRVVSYVPRVVSYAPNIFIIKATVGVSSAQLEYVTFFCILFCSKNCCIKQ